MTTLGWGIVATGNIANKFCTDLTHCKGHRIVAVTSRQQDKALAFAKRFDIPHAYDHYPSLLQRPDVDVVYIATPHSAHYQNVVQALEAGKHVVCEKPITLTLQQAEHCVALAKQKRLFLMEAVWMYFFPSLAQVKSWLDEGRIGAPISFEANFDFYAKPNPSSRLFDSKLGGGALMDIGLYPLFLATHLFGDAQIVSAQPKLNHEGVDVAGVIQCQHQSGTVSHSHFSFLVDKPCVARIQGEHGSIQLHDRFFCTNSVLLHTSNHQPITQDFAAQGLGYRHEIHAVRNAIYAGKIEADAYPHAMMLRNHQLLAQAKTQLGIHYEDD